jgi:hypothetical protein
LFLKKQKLQLLPRYAATTVKKFGKITVYAISKGKNGFL